MENFEETFQAENALNVNKEIEVYLRETSRWAKFLAVLGFIMMGLMVLAGVGMATVFPEFKGSAGPVYSVVMALAYVAFAALYFFPLLYLYRFSSRIKEALVVQSESALTSGFENLKSLFKFTGIFTIVFLSLYLLIILVVVVIGTTMSQWF